MFKVLQPYQPRESDELELLVGDVICVTEEAIENSKDGWIDGLSCGTGLSGLFPLAYTVRAPESDAWTLHCSVPLCLPSKSERRLAANSEQESRNGSCDLHVFQRSNDDADIELLTATANTETVPNPADQPVNAKNLHDFIRKIIVWDASVGTFVEKPNDAQKLFIMRHGERVDFTFAKWVNVCFDQNGVYRRVDINLPKILPIRANPQEAWKCDTPLTNMGCHQAFLTGDMLKDVGISIEFAYTSPSFRCVQTCHSLLKGLGIQDQIKIRVEPGLFEWCGWYPDTIPELCSKDELKSVGFNIDPDYVPLVSIEDLGTRYKNETIDDFYRRCHLISDNVTKITSKYFIENRFSFPIINFKLYFQLKISSWLVMHQTLKQIPAC